MIITKDFVFIHMPKTGGTFVHGIFKKIIVDYKQKHPVKWYINRVLYRLNFANPIYQKLNSVNYYEYPNKFVAGQHGGAAYIPKKLCELPIISVKRDPVKKFVSAYYYRWWERFPSLPTTQLKELYPHYPDISIEEYFDLANNHVMRSFFKEDLRDDIGVLSWQFIRMYSKQPLTVYKNITQNNYSEFIENYFVDVKFFEMDDLSFEFENYIKSTSFSNYSDYFRTKERIYPPGSSPKKELEPISDLLTNKIRKKEWMLFKFFPEYNI